MNYTPIEKLLSAKSLDYTPLSSEFGKEAEPPVASETKDGTFSIHEIVEYEPEKTVKPYITHRPDTITVPEDLSQMGVVAHSNPTFTTEKEVKLPLSDEKVEEGLHAPVTSSFRWFAEICLFTLKKAHLVLKQIHGKVVRVAV